MKVFFHKDFYQVYTSDPAAAAGRMEAVVRAIEPHVTLTAAEPAAPADIAACHGTGHIERIRRLGLYPIAALAAGAAVQAALEGLRQPAFAAVRPPGHHASADSAWGFCYFNNMAVALTHLKNEGRIAKAFILDFDLHYGDGTVNILGDEPWVRIYNPADADANRYLQGIEAALPADADIIAVSAGFDNHREDWGGLLSTEDYREIGRMVRAAARRSGGGCFGILEGGYNHSILGRNVRAFIEGLEE